MPARSFRLYAEAIQPLSIREEIMFIYRTILLLAVAVLLPVAGLAQEKTAEAYTCPMHPQIISETQGTCPICGMDLVPVEGHDHGAHEAHETEAGGRPVVAIETGTIQKMGVRTEPVASEEGRLTVPSSAILRSSSGSHVIVALGEGRFQGREVETGRVREGRTEIHNGLEAGERVVTRAQFMIDAESNLREALDKFKGGGHAGH